MVNKFLQNIYYSYSFDESLKQKLTPESFTAIKLELSQKFPRRSFDIANDLPLVGIPVEIAVLNPTIIKIVVESITLNVVHIKVLDVEVYQEK